MNRRGFLNALGLGAAAITFDPELILWTKRKTIFIPSPSVVPPADIYSGTLGFCCGMPVPLSAVNTDTMGPLFEQNGNLYRIVELKPDHHIHQQSSTIFAVPGGKLQVMVHGVQSLMIGGE